MAIPILKFKDVSIPYKIREGERRIISMEVKPNAVGKTMTSLFLTASQCSFDSGKKELNIEFDATNATEKKIVSFNVILKGQKPMTYMIKIGAKAVNADKAKNKIGLLTKLDCKNPMINEEEQTVTFEENSEPQPIAEIEEIVIAPVIEENEEDETPDSEPTDEPENN